MSANVKNIKPTFPSLLVGLNDDIEKEELMSS